MGKKGPVLKVLKSQPGLTRWFCEKCKTRGEVRHEPKVDVFTGVYLLRDAHRAASPCCNNPTGMLRVLNEERMAPKNWRRFYSMTPAS